MTKYREIIRLSWLKAKPTTSKRMFDFEHVLKELLRNGVNKKLLWAEYLEECRLSKEEPLLLFE